MTEEERSVLAEYEKEMLDHVRELMAEYRRLAAFWDLLWLRGMQDMDWDEADRYEDHQQAVAAVSEFKPVMWWS